MNTIYLDSMASTYVNPKVLTRMLEIYRKFPGNPSSDHRFAQELQAIILQAEQQVLTKVNSNEYKVYWTSGATEAINTAIFGACGFYNQEGKTIITFATEHKATLATCKQLTNLGYNVKVLPVNNFGHIDIDLLLDTITNDTILVSLCHVNNEIGTIQHINEIVPKLQSLGCLVHIDAAQSIGKIELDLAECPADYVSLSAHKFEGPQGVGALLVKNNRQLSPIMYGGKQQVIRPGTLPAALIAGMGMAAELSKVDTRVVEWHNQLKKLFLDIGGIGIHGCLKHRVPHNLNINISGINIESFKYLNNNLALASGSACNAQGPDPSHVLLALGYRQAYAGNSIRISLGGHLLDSDIAQFSEQFTSSVLHLRRLSGWQC